MSGTVQSGTLGPAAAGGSAAAVWAVVLAGGNARRFGSDKLEARLGDRRLLEHAIDGLPPRSRLILVGPPRGLSETGLEVEFVREEPPGGGPAAAMVRGLAGVLDRDPADHDVVLVLPADAPGAGRAATRLRQALDAVPGGLAVVGTDAQQRDQPLQLALRPAAAARLVAAAGEGAGAGASARALIARLGPDLRRVRLAAAGHADVDTPADLARLAATLHPPDDLRNDDRA